MTELSARTRDRINGLFPVEQRNEVEDLLREECGANLPFCENNDQYGMERIRFAVLKLSEGNREKLVQAIELAQADWRDVLMASGFGEDVEAHNRWTP